MLPEESVRPSTILGNVLGLKDMLSGLDRLVKRGGAGDGDSTGDSRSRGSNAGLNGRELESDLGREDMILKGREAG